MPRRKVFFIISSLRFGGAEKQTIELINHLDSKKFEIFLCYIKNEDNLKNDLNMDQLSGLFCLDKKKRFEIRVLLKLKEIINQVQPETVVCVNLYPAFYVHLLRTIFRINFQIIQVAHTTIISNLYTDIIVRVLYKRLLNRSEQVVFVCKNQMNYWINKYGIKKNLCQYIYNGVNTDYFNFSPSLKEKNQIRERLNIRKPDIVICICAALRPEKRHVDLIDAGKILIERGLPIKILIVGNGPERENIEKHIKKLGMEKNVTITGFQHDVRPYVAISDIVTLASVAVETFSMAILEAMALGKAVVATDIGGASEQIVHGVNGFIFPAGDTQALAKHLAVIITENLFIEMGKKSRDMVVESFNLDAMVKRYQEVLSDS